jgi:hypothetical protein
VTRYIAERKAFIAVIIIGGHRPGDPNQEQIVGPFMTKGAAASAITEHRKRVWKKSFIDGWVESATEWERT